MAATKLELTVYYEDDTETKVVADQRDIVVFESKMHVGFVNALEAMPITLFRFLAYQALVRTGVVPVSVKHPDWAKTVIAVEPEEDEPVTPTDPEATEES